jgi:hypothetical protein
MRVDVGLVACAGVAYLTACGSVPVVASADSAPTVAISKSKRSGKAKRRRGKPAAQENPYAQELAEPELPRHCATDSGRCFPPKEFVATLCQGKYPDVALVMFRRSAPWQHAYVRVKDVRPINALGGPAGDARMEFSEEVLLLAYHRHTPTGGMEISGALDSYVVLRFDGTCATLAEDEFMSYRPGRSRYAPVIWRQLDRGIRRALSESKRVEKARVAQSECCRGSFLAGGSPACQRATQKLAKAILRALDRGAELPTPKNIPDWSPD